MSTPEPEARLSVKLRSPWDKSAAWARVLTDGRLELELYDFSPEAQAHMGNDVAWMYRVSPVHMPKLYELLEKRTGSPIVNDEMLLQVIAETFAHAHAVRDWLRENTIPFEEEFDSWA
ncbi:MAG: hypothetical protein IT165_31295 [Bryobacterales bacterium]|nr:hypothetical protein [Bryobacterales bacterium]